MIRLSRPIRTFENAHSSWWVRAEIHPVIPLVRFVSDRRKMGKFAIPTYVAAIAWIVAGVIVILNLKLLSDTLFG